MYAKAGEKSRFICDYKALHLGRALLTVGPYFTASRICDKTTQIVCVYNRRGSSWATRAGTLRDLSADNPIDGGSADAVASGEVGAVVRGVGELGLESGGLLRRQLRLGAELDAGCLGAGDAFGGALLDEVALEFADSGQHVEQQAAGRAAGIDGLVEDDEVDLLGGDLRRDLGEVEDGAGEAIEPRDDQLVALADEREGLGQRLALVAPSLGGMAAQGTAAAFLLLEDPVAALAVQLVELDVQALPDRRDARISDSHVS